MAHCSQPLLSRLVQHRFRCTSGPRHRRSAMRSVDRLQVQTSSGWMDIGNRLVAITGGSGDAGTVLHMKGHTGAIRTMTTIAKAGEMHEGHWDREDHDNGRRRDHDRDHYDRDRDD